MNAPQRFLGLKMDYEVLVVNNEKIKEGYGISYDFYSFKKARGLLGKLGMIKVNPPEYYNGTGLYDTKKTLQEVISDASRLLKQRKYTQLHLEGFDANDEKIIKEALSEVDKEITFPDVFQRLAFTIDGALRGLWEIISDNDEPQIFLRRN